MLASETEHTAPAIPDRWGGRWGANQRSTGSVHHASLPRGDSSSTWRLHYLSTWLHEKTRNKPSYLRLSHSHHTLEHQEAGLHPGKRSLHGTNTHENPAAAAGLVSGLSAPSPPPTRALTRTPAAAAGSVLFPPPSPTHTHEHPSGCGRVGLCSPPGEAIGIVCTGCTDAVGVDVGGAGSDGPEPKRRVREAV